MSATRTVIVTNERIPWGAKTPQDALRIVARYLPSNYTAVVRMDDKIAIWGTDVAGWTMDDYVIPRLASGGIYVKEIASP